jgi:hypothetical protein
LGASIVPCCEGRFHAFNVCLRDHDRGLPRKRPASDATFDLVTMPKPVTAFRDETSSLRKQVSMTQQSDFNSGFIPY